ncbi:hypothetical protein GYH30_018707 [Glycine max]|nr:hypothetical protein GYH30_018707 [Glycine max]
MAFISKPRENHPEATMALLASQTYSPPLRLKGEDTSSSFFLEEEEATSSYRDLKNSLNSRDASSDEFFKQPSIPMKASFSGSDFSAGEASCNSSRASLAGKGDANSRNEFLIDSKRNRRFEKENEVEGSESWCVDSASFASECSRNLILKFKRDTKNLEENDDVSEACTKSEITTVLKFKSRSESKNLKQNDGISCAKSIRSQTRTTSSSFGVRAWSFNEENCADLIAQSMTKHESDVYNVVTDLACSEDLCFSYCDDDGDESKYCSSQGTVFSEFHFEIFGECSQAELSDYSPSLFVDSESQFLEGSVGETPSPTHLLFLRYRKEFAALVSAPPVKNASNIEDAANVDWDDEDSYQMLRKRERKQGFVSNYGDRYFSTTEFGDIVIEQRALMVQWIVEQSCRRQLRQETVFLGVSLLDRFLSKLRILQSQQKPSNCWNSLGKNVSSLVLS